jgi:hypothetical protein
MVALDALMGEDAFADVVREAQEAVELALKGLLRAHHVSPPRIQRSLRRDRELAFYGSEDLIPSAFYQRDDAVRAIAQAHRVVEVCELGLGMRQ